MNIVIGADHHGYRYKEGLKHKFNVAGYDITWIDVGSHNETRTNYPVYAKKACEVIRAKEAEYGILICGTGVGMAIAANRFEYIYAALAWNEEVARLSKEHDNANILVIPSDFVTEDEMYAMVRAWLTASFLGGAYQERIKIIDGL